MKIKITYNGIVDKNDKTGEIYIIDSETNKRYTCLNADINDVDKAKSYELIKKEPSESDEMPEFFANLI